MPDRVERADNREPNGRLRMSGPRQQRFECAGIADAGQRAADRDGRRHVIEDPQERLRGAAAADPSERRDRRRADLVLLGAKRVDEGRDGALAVADE